MTDDEAFIRAIVAAPADEAPRLVYADWLDGCRDLRGAYLRAELAWAKGDRTVGHGHLIPLAEQLDPIWVARIGRPPAGVCCDQIAFRSDHALPTQAQLDGLEKRLRIKLPPEYRAFLLNYNGGSPWPKWFPLGSDEYGTLFSFFWVEHSRRGKNDQWSSALEDVGSLGSEGAGRSFLPIAEGLPIDDWTHLCLRVAGEGTGRVYVTIPDEGAEEPVRQVADSLPELLDRIIDIRPDWVRMIQDGNVDRFKAWLQAGGDIDVRYQERRFEPTTPLLSALEWRQDEIVSELLARGATVPQDLWYVYQDMIPDDLVHRVRPPNFVDPGPFDT